MARTSKTEAVVLRSFRLGEADRVLLVYTADRGRIGAVGNGVAAIVWERGIPNPIVMDIGQAVIAFNLADIFTLVGVLLLMVELSSVTIRNRNQLLPPRQFARMLWQRVRP